ncbi:MAG: IPT/TIG domain-containing protein [Thermoleophilaceae bacterium]
MRVSVNRTITIRGTGFSAVRRRNTVILKGAAGRLSFAKPLTASSTTLVVRIPTAAERILTQKSAGGVPTRVSLRVVTSRYGKVSIRRHSPILVSAGQ